MQLSEGWVFELINPLVGKLNTVLTNLLPNGQLYIVLLSSGLIAYYIKNKYNWGKIAFLMATITIYSSLRFFGVGN